MVELGQEARFALKAAEDVLVLRLRCREDLERHDLAERVGGLVHAAHLPLADAVQNLVAADEEAVGAAALDHLRLPLGQVAPRGEVLAELIDLILGSARLLAPPLEQRRDLVGREQLALGEQGAVVAHGCSRVAIVRGQRTEDRGQREQKTEVRAGVWVFDFDFLCPLGSLLALRGPDQFQCRGSSRASSSSAAARRLSGRVQRLRAPAPPPAGAVGGAGCRGSPSLQRG